MPDVFFVYCLCLNILIVYKFEKDINIHGNCILDWTPTTNQHEARYLSKLWIVFVTDMYYWNILQIDKKPSFKKTTSLFKK